MSGAFALGEGYNLFNPLADTELARDYTPEKYKTLKTGMHMKEIQSIIGEPLYSRFDTTTKILTHCYTKNGYLMKKKDKKFSLVRDQAWFGSSVEYDKDSVVVNLYSTWYFD